MARAIQLGGRKPAYDVEILRNRIRGAMENGIAGGFFDPQGVEDGIVMGLRIVGNEIVDCVSEQAERQSGMPFGGIVLGRVYDLEIHDNRIERNGEQARVAVCGIFAAHSRNVQITRNLLRDNGRLADGELLPGPQAGIALRDAGTMAVMDPHGKESGTFRVSAVAAVRIDGNVVESRRGPALWIAGMGAMQIRDNRLAAIDILADLQDEITDAADAYVGSVYLMNRGLPGYLAGWLAALGFDGLKEGFTLQGQPVERLVVGGQVQFTGNQVRLDLTAPTSELALANMLIFSLDDTSVANNQSEGVLGRDLLLCDLLNFAITTRVTGNGFMSTPLLTAFSILSLGLFNHCTNNQATSCIRAFGFSPKSFIGNNAVIWPHPTYCAEDNVIGAM